MPSEQQKPATPRLFVRYRRRVRRNWPWLLARIAEAWDYTGVAIIVAVLLALSIYATVAAWLALTS